jgi:hypothetical protein
MTCSTLSFAIASSGKSDRQNGQHIEFTESGRDFFRSAANSWNNRLLLLLRDTLFVFYMFAS